MMATSFARLPRTRPAWTAIVPVLVSVCLLAAIGIELAVLVAWLPDTLRHLTAGDPGDFRNLYDPGSHRQLIGMYSPALTLLLYPLAPLGVDNAYRVMFCADAASACAIAWIAQRAVRSPEARIAVALAVLSLPEMHWAVRLGHVTPVLALAALGGLVLLPRRPKLGAALLAILSIKPQYAIAPFVLRASRRSFRLLGVMLVTAGGAAAAGFAAIGPHAVGQFFGYYLDWGPNSTENLLPVQQAWMYSWPGTLISAGIEPNKLLTADLLLLSLGVTVGACARLDISKAATAAALSMILLTPYSQFYDACLVAVAMALVLRCRMRPLLAGTMFAALWGAAVLTQARTHYPVQDVLGPAASGGVYWLAPALLAAIAVLALTGARIGRTEVRSGG